jgi:DNA-binding response OmpR family regulator
MRNRLVVLVVEDEIPVQTTLCATLALAGFATRRADDVESALSILDVVHIEAVILDVRLPDRKGLQRSGLTLLSYLRTTRDYLQTPVVIFTGVPLSDEDEAFVRRHDAQLFYKPRPYRAIIDALQKMLGVRAISGATLPAKERRL